MGKSGNMMERELSKVVLLIVVFLLVLSAVPTYALNQVVNGSFEDGVVGFWQDPRDQPLPPPWNAWDAREAGHPYGNWNINIDGHDNIPPAPPDGQHCASVCAGMNNSSGGIWQEVDVTPGLTFYLSGAYYAGNAWDSSTTVTAQFWLFNTAPTFSSTTGDLITTGGVAALQHSGPRTSNWTSFYGGGLTATGNRLYIVSRFRVTDPWAAYGMHMDNLQLQLAPDGSTVVPEPGSLVGLAGCVGILGLIVRRRR